jgi:hypothetical protein
MVGVRRRQGISLAGPSSVVMLLWTLTAVIVMTIVMVMVVLVVVVAVCRVLPPHGVGFGGPQPTHGE